MLAEHDLTFTAGIPLSQQKIQSMHFTVSDERKSSDMCLDVSLPKNRNAKEQKCLNRLQAEICLMQQGGHAFLAVQVFM